MSLKRLIPTVAFAGFLLGALAVALVAGPLWHVGNLSPAAAAKPSLSAPPSDKVQAACDAFLKDFADKLNVSQDKVKTSLKAAINDAIDRAVKNGDMTADQATEAKAKVDAVKGCESIPAFGKRFGAAGRAGGMPAEMPGGMAGLAGITNAAATALGVTPADLRSAVISGKSLHEIAGTGVSKTDFDTKFRAALATEIQPQVASGKLTADQAKGLVDQAANFAGKLWDTNMKDAMGGFFGNHGGAPRVPPGAASTTQ